MAISERLRRAAARVSSRSDEWGRRFGVLPYRTERVSSAQWSASYRTGELDFYGDLEELGRYSLVVGYARWTASTTGGRPALLDVGCGSGLLRDRLEGVDIAEYVGIDISEVAIDAARAKCHPNARFVVGDLMNTELEQYDIVVVNEMLYYAVDPAALLRRVRELACRGAIVVVSMWRHSGDYKLWRQVDQALHQVDRVEIRNRSNPRNRRGWIVACYRVDP